MDVAVRVAEAALDTPRSPKKQRSDALDETILQVPMDEGLSRVGSVSSTVGDQDGTVVYVSSV